MDCPLTSEILGEVGRAASPPIQASGGYNMHSEAGVGRKVEILVQLVAEQVLRMSILQPM